MAIKLYWNQSRVYFFGMAVYFPERLIGHNFNSSELDEIFPEGYDDYIVIKKAKGSSEIMSLKSDPITELFDEYLKDYYFDKLTTLKSSKPANYGALIVKLFEIVTATKAIYGTSPIIKLINLWPEEKDRTIGMMPFWELFFAEARMGKEFSIINFDFDGAYVGADRKRHPLPFVEIKLNFGSVMYEAVTHIPRLQVPKPLATFNTTLELRSHGFVVVRDGQELELKRLATGKQYHNFLTYLSQHPNEIILLDDIKEEVAGAKQANDLTELVRLSGFKPVDKKRFFAELSSDRLQFKLRANMTEEEFDEIKNRK